MRACPSPFPENRRSTASRASKISGKSYGGSPRTYFFGKGVPWHTCRREREISNRADWSRFIDRHISHTDGALLLIRPGMALQIIVERLVATVERLDFVLLFETTDENGHSASHCSDEGFRWMAGPLDARSAEALQFARCPRNVHTWEYEFRATRSRRGNTNSLRSPVSVSLKMR